MVGAALLLNDVELFLVLLSSTSNFAPRERSYGAKNGLDKIDTAVVCQNLHGHGVCSTGFQESSNEISAFWTTEEKMQEETHGQSLSPRTSIELTCVQRDVMK